MALYLPFIFCAFISINTIERLKKTINILVVLMVYVSGYALTHGGKGSGNYFIDENDVSLYINMWLPFCYFLLFVEKQRAIRALYITGLVLGISAVVYSRSRGGFVGLLAVGFIIWLYSPNKLVTLTIIGLSSLIIIAFASQNYWNEMSTITDLSERTSSTRIESWKAAWKIFIDHPFGVGGNNFQVWFDKYQSEYFKRGMWGRVAHSLWFTLIPEVGLVGIYIYLRLLYHNLKDIFYLKNINSKENSDKKFINYLAIAFLSSLAGYFSSGTFLSVLYYSHYWYLTALIIATNNITKKILSET
jgi:probable O-glycosylation ligase (exosortase A-associated)